MDTIIVDPVTRLEGHLKIEVDVDGNNRVKAARSSGTLFRGFEKILIGRDPRDATHLTQRICGVCPVSHGMASALCLENAFGVTPPDNGRIMRNLVLGANFLQSHILHFYHLAALDFVKGPEMPPWTPRYDDGKPYDHPTAFYRFDPDTTGVIVGNYLQALEMRMKAHEMAAIFAGKLPHVPNFVPGGITEVPTGDDVSLFRTYLDELRVFIKDVYVNDVLAVAGAYPEYFDIGVGCGNLLAYGVFDQDAAGSSKLLPRGRYTEGELGEVDPQYITEYVQYSWYTLESGGLDPAFGVTEPYPNKPGAYSWLKSPRYNGTVYEVGPLARMFVAYLNGVPRVVELINLHIGEGNLGLLFSVLGRHAARALECQFIAESMVGWLEEIVDGEPAYTYSNIPRSSTGMGLTEAPRGALGHWMDIDRSKIARYQVITPTNWNASPRDDLEQSGPIEQALVGLVISDPDQPIEVLRVIHSFDPCLACSVHLITPGNDVRKFTVGGSV